MNIATASEHDIQSIGERIGRAVRGGEVFEMVGDVGAGKTTLTRAIARGMGITSPIQSPTFTIANRHQAPSGLGLVHYDFYRLPEAGIMSDELDETLHDDGVVTVVEWGDVVADVLPSRRITIELAAADSSDESVRSLVGTAHTNETRQWLEEIA